MQRPISSPIAWCMGLAVSIARLLLGAVLTSSGTKWLVGDSAGPGYRLFHFKMDEQFLLSQNDPSFSRDLASCLPLLVPNWPLKSPTMNSIAYFDPDQDFEISSKCLI